eukprot:UC4_evm5s1162
MARSDYNQYLSLIQERNRILRRLKDKENDAKAAELKKREEGFSTYCSGANASKSRPLTTNRKRRIVRSGGNGRTLLSSSASRSTSSYSASVDDGRKRNRDNEDLRKSRSAPVNTRLNPTGSSGRRTWSKGSVKIKTSEGRRTVIHAPSALTGCYDDDFDNDDFDDDDVDRIDENNDNDEIRKFREKVSDLQDKELDNHKGKYKKGIEYDYIDPDEKINVTISNVKDDDRIAKEIPSPLSHSERRASIDKNGQNIPDKLMIDSSLLSKSVTEDYSISSEKDFIDTETEVVESLLCDEETITECLNESIDEIHDNEYIITNIIEVEDEKKTEKMSQLDDLALSNMKKDQTEFPSTSEKYNKSEECVSSSSLECVLPIFVNNNEHCKDHNNDNKPGEDDGQQDVDDNSRLYISKKQNTPDHTGTGTPCVDSVNIETRNKEGDKSTTEYLNTQFNQQCQSPNLHCFDEIDSKLSKIEIQNVMDPSSPVVKKTLDPITWEISLSPAKSKNDNRKSSTPISQRKEYIPCDTSSIYGTSEKENDISGQVTYNTNSTSLEAQRPGTYKVVKEEEKILSPVNKGCHCKLELILKSSWTNFAKDIGLTEIQFFDVSGSPILPDPESLRVQGCASSRARVLINTKTKTTDQTDMWTAPMPENGSPLILEFSFLSVNVCIDYVKIWNYNRSINHVGCGAKEAEICINGNTMWEGILKMAKGSKNRDYCQILELRDVLNKREKQVLENTCPSPSNKKDDNHIDVLPDFDFDSIDNKDTKIEVDWLQSNIVQPEKIVDDQRCEDPDNFLPDWLQQASLSQLSIEPSPQSNGESFVSIERVDTGSSDIGEQAPDSSYLLKNLSDFSLPQASYNIRSKSRAERYPSGKCLKIIVHSTWGDPHYVGLTGIELHSAEKEKIDDFTIIADPSDINSLPEYETDPRVITNLKNGINDTCDSSQMWLAPLLTGTELENSITIEFEKMTRLASMTVWNYNKSERDVCRGARCISIFFDGELLFHGEIACAPGISMAKNPKYTGTFLQFTNRPKKNLNDLEMKCAETNIKLMTTPIRMLSEVEDVDGTLPEGRVLEFHFHDTWGDMHYMGLTGIEIYREDGNVISIHSDQLSACPQDLNDLPNCSGDWRTLDKLVNGKNVSINDANMWMIPYNPGCLHKLSIDLGKNFVLSGFKLWNYNKSSEDTIRGVRTMSIYMDGKSITPSQRVEVRKACGVRDFDFGQNFNFDSLCGACPKRIDESCSHHQTNPGTPRHLRMLSLDYSPTIEPSGFVFSIRLLSTWSGSGAIGLNGIEFLDERGQNISLSSIQIGVSPDIRNRTSQHEVRRLINGINNSRKRCHGWIAPDMGSEPVTLNFLFDTRTTVSALRLWNYAPSKEIQLNEFEVLVDGKLVLNGSLNSICGLKASKSFHQTFLFTGKSFIIEQEREYVRATSEEPHIKLIDENTVVNEKN